MTAVSRWIFSLRAYSFPASLMPVLLAAALAATADLTVSWAMLPLYAIAALLFHAGTNVLNDYYDYRHGVDRPSDPDPTHAITRGIVTPRFMAVSGHLYFAAGIAAGSLIALERGTLFFVAGLAGALAAYFYTSARFSLKYRALGDVAVFLLMGLALTTLGYWALTGLVDATALLASLPLAFFVTAILHGNNMRDIEADAAAGVDTVARRLGFGKSKALFVGLFVCGYAMVAAGLLAGLFGWPVLASALSLPVAWAILRRVRAAGSGEALIDLPARTAAFHLLFSTLYCAGVLVGGVAG